MLSALKILLLIIGLLNLPFGFIIGVPFMAVAVPCLAGCVVIDRYQAQQKAGGLQTPTARIIWSFLIILLGIGFYVGIVSFGGLGNLDTTGQADSGTKTDAVIFSVCFAAGGLYLVNRKRSWNCFSRRR